MTSLSFIPRAVTLATTLLAATVLSTAACSQKSVDAAPANGKAGAAARKGRTVVLATADVGTVQRQTIAEGVAVTGTLRPIESIEIHARLEGNIQGVYVREGQHVAAGQLLARFESVSQRGDVASAQAAEAAAQSELSTATWNREQSEELFKAGAVAEADYRAAQQAERAAQAKLAAAKAVVQSSQLNERDTRVVAPAAGVIDVRSVQPGEHVANGAMLFTLVRNGTLELAAAVPERRASSVRVGQRVTITADGRTLQGKVARVSPTVDPASRTVTVYVDFANADGTLKGGAFAQGAVFARTVPNALVIPLNAVHQQNDGAQPVVYRVNSGTIEEVNVTRGIIDDRNGLVQIVSGLSAGDRIVTGNLGTLTNGAPAQIIGDDSPARR
jgi:RND family efflux transporter MFP subunit